MACPNTAKKRASVFGSGTARGGDRRRTAPVEERFVRRGLVDRSLRQVIDPADRGRIGELAAPVEEHDAANRIPPTSAIPTIVFVPCTVAPFFDLIFCCIFMSSIFLSQLERPMSIHVEMTEKLMTKKSEQLPMRIRLY
jgi:hypothetical protein